MRHSDILSFVPPHFVAFAWRYRLTSPVSSLRLAADDSHPPARAWISGTPGTGVLRAETTGLPRFLGDPRGRAGFLDPGGTATSGRGPLSLRADSSGAQAPRRLSSPRPCDIPASPSAFGSASAPTVNFFRGSITRPAHPLSTLRRADHSATTQDSLPAGGHPCRTGLHPARSLRRFQSARHPPSPGFSWRKPHKNQTPGWPPTRSCAIFPSDRRAASPPIRVHRYLSVALGRSIQSTFTKRIEFFRRRRDVGLRSAATSRRKNFVERPFAGSAAEGSGGRNDVGYYYIGNISRLFIIHVAALGGCLPDSYTPRASVRQWPSGRYPRQADSVQPRSGLVQRTHRWSVRYT
jgi:hypothetical protein